MLRLHNLRPRPGARHRVKRLGIGESSGHGKTSGKGHKGQKARSGGSIRPGFEGGQMPLIRRLPKRGFNNAAFHKEYAIVNLSDLNRFEAGAVVDEKALRQAKLIRGSFHGIKILGEGDLQHALTLEVDKVSTSAREKIEKAGGAISSPRSSNQRLENHTVKEAESSKKAAPAGKSVRRVSQNKRGKISSKSKRKKQSAKR